MHQSLLGAGLLQPPRARVHSEPAAHGSVLGGEPVDGGGGFMEWARRAREEAEADQADRGAHGDESRDGANEYLDFRDARLRRLVLSVGGTGAAVFAVILAIT